MPISIMAAMAPGIFTAHEDHVFLEDFAGAVARAGDVGGDFLCGQIGVHVRPHGVRVGDHFAVDGQVGCQSEVPVRRREREGRAVDVGGEDDAVIAEAHFDDVGHAVLGAGLDLAVADRTRRVRDIGGVFADALAETAQTGGRPAGFNDRGREIEVFAKGFCDDGRIRQNRRGPCDLHGVAGLRGSGNRRNCQNGNRGRGKLQMGHDFSIGFCPGRQGVLSALPIHAA
jgi:hypothetical protein